MNGPEKPACIRPAGAARRRCARRTAPTTFSAFFSPRNPTNGWLWGLGPVVQIPTISNASLGSNVWGGGPTGVLVYMKGPWVARVLANNVWSFGRGAHHKRKLSQHQRRRNDVLVGHRCASEVAATAIQCGPLLRLFGARLRHQRAVSA